MMAMHCGYNLCISKVVSLIEIVNFSDFMLLNHIIIYVMQTAKPDTVEKVIEIVTKQLCSEKGVVQPHSKFGDLGADSLDQVILFTRKATVLLERFC